MRRTAIECVKDFFDQDKIRYNIIDENAIELYMQARNLTMHLMIYQHNGHLIFRVPGFIRNVELNRLDVLMFIMKIMNEILDIRFEVSADGKTLSACCHHIIEDGEITRAQFDLAMMIIMHIVDDTYPQFLQILYSNDKKAEEFAPVSRTQPARPQADTGNEISEEIEEPEEEDDDEKNRKKGLKIN